MKDAESIRISEQADLAFYEEEIFKLEKVVNEEIKPKLEYLETSVVSLKTAFEEVQRESETLEKEQSIHYGKIDELKLK